MGEHTALPTSGPITEEAGRARVRVLIVDDHEVLSSSLAMVLDSEPDLQTVGRAGTLADARRAVVETAPDVVLLDHQLPDGDGVASIEELRALGDNLAFVVLTASTSDSVLLAAVHAGASGFVSKTRGVSEVTAAVRAAAAGEAVISPELLMRLLPRFRGQPAEPSLKLTEREQEVLTLLADGLSNAAISQRLVVSVHTVRNHVANLANKLGAHSRLEVLSIAMRKGLVQEK
jgi:DNA-binding NarL/FixJ family response regulator